MRRCLSVVLAFVVGCLSAVLLVAPASAAASPPVILNPANNSYKTTTTPVISGTAPRGAFITVILDGTQRNNVATAANNGNWSWTVPTALAFGNHTVSARQFDNAGSEETSPFSTSTRFTVGPNPPFVFSLEDGASTDDTTPTFSGGAVGGQIISVYIDGEFTEPGVEVGGAGDWEWTPDTALAPGPHTFEATAFERGVESPPAGTINFTIVVSAPDAPVVTSPENNSFTNDETPKISGTADTKTEEVRVFIDGSYSGSATPDADNKWAYTSPLLTEGEHEVYAVARDTKSNDSDPSKTNKFTVDITAPDRPVVLVPAAGDVTGVAPTVSGTAEARSTVRVFIDGADFGNTAVDSDGTWSISVSGLTDGSHRVSARAVDRADNISELASEVEWNVDATPPSAPAIVVPADNGFTNNSGQGISGTGEPGATIHLTVAGGTDDITVDGDGNWEWFPGDPLADGLYPVSVTQTDAVGNVSPATEIAFTIDTVVVPPVIADPVQGGYLGATGPITGTAEPGATVHINLDDQDAGTVTADSKGNWSFEPAGALAEGGHSVLTFQDDVAGNRSSPVQSDFTVDLTAPEVPAIVVPADNAVTKDNGQQISGTGEPGATINLNISGFVVHVVVDGAGNWEWAPGDPFPDGVFTLTATQTDPAGNVSPVTAEVSFTVDTGAAPPAISSPLAGGYLNHVGPVTGTAEPGATVYVTIDGVSAGSVVANDDGDWTFYLDDVLADGSHTTEAYQVDIAGNTSEASTEVEFDVDSQQPELPVITTPANNALVASSTVTLSGTGEPGATVAVQVDRVNVGQVLVDSSGNWTLDLTLTDGVHDVRAGQTDPAGNGSEGTARISVTVDTTAPAAPVIEFPEAGYVAPTGNFRVSGLGEVGATVTVYVDGKASGTVLVDPNGEWSLNVAPALDSGTYVVTAGQTDPAGNDSTLSAELTVEVDVTAPLAPKIAEPSPGDTVYTATPTVSGTGEPGATVSVSTGGVEIGTGVVQPDGTWTVTTSALPDGGLTLSVTMTDPVGNISPPTSVAVIIDATAPAVPVLITPVDGASLGTTSPVLTGTAEADSVVTILVAGIAYDTVQVDPSGNFSYTFSPPLTDGTYVITLTAGDGGNTSEPTAAVTITVDTVAPDPATITAPADQAELGTGLPLITGTGEPGATVTVTIDRVSVGTAVVDGSGNWSVTLTTPIGEGEYDIRVTQTDPAGNTSPESDITVYIDTTAPDAPSIASPTAEDPVGPVPTISGTTQPGATVHITLDGVEVDVVADEAGDWSYEPTTPLVSGPHTLSVTAEDSVGNVSDPTAVAFVVDADAPKSPAITAPLNGAALADGSVVVSGTAEPGATVSVLVGGVEVGTATAGSDGVWTLTITPELEEGTYEITARQTDAVGNVSVASAVTTIKVDTTSPDQPAVLVPGDGDTLYSGTPTVSGTGEAGATIVVRVGDAQVGTTVVKPDGTWTLITTALVDGAQKLVVTQTDPAGNESESYTVAVTVDTTAPAVPVLVSPVDGALLNSSTPVLTGSGEAGSTVLILVGGVEVGRAEVGEDGKFSFTFPTELTDGNYVITLEAYDGGNTSPPSAAVKITVDTEEPGLPVVTTPVDGASLNTGPTFAGTGERGATITVFIDDEEVGTAVVDSDGNWSLTPTLDPPLAEGPHVAVVIQTDPAGNESEGVNRTFLVDTVAPPIPVVTSPDGTDPDASVGRVSGTGEPGSTITVYLDGSKTGAVTVKVDEDGNWTVELPVDLASGQHTFEVSASDAAGNESGRTEPITFQAIESPVITSPADGDRFTNRRPVFTGTGEPLATIEVRETTGDDARQQLVIQAPVGGRLLATTTVDADGNWTATPSEDLDPGVYTTAAYQMIEDLTTRLSDPVTFTITGNAGGGGDGGGDDDNSGDSSGDSLAKTGGPQLAAGLAGLTLTLIGGLSLVLARRRSKMSR